MNVSTRPTDYILIIDIDGQPLVGGEVNLNLNVTLNTSGKKWNVTQESIKGKMIALVLVIIDSSITPGANFPHVFAGRVQSK